MRKRRKEACSGAPSGNIRFEEAQVARSLQAEMENRNFRQILVVNGQKAKGFGRDNDWKPRKSKLTMAASLVLP